MSKKFKLTSNTKVVFGITFYQIEYLETKTFWQRGELGGWLEMKHDEFLDVEILRMKLMIEIALYQILENL